MKTIELKLYEFEELSDEAKEKAREWFRSGHEFDHEYIIEDVKNIGELMGISIDNVYYSGFWSQGDGACFEGSYKYAKDSVKAVKEYAPNDTELHNIAIGLQETQRSHFYGLTANVKHRGRCYHELCTAIDVYNRDGYHANEKAEEEVSESLRLFMKWIYKKLEEQYEYEQTDEYVDECISINEYEFTEDGERY